MVIKNVVYTFISKNSTKFLKFWVKFTIILEKLKIFYIIYLQII